MNLETEKTERLFGIMAKYNPRKISEHDMAALRRSLKAFGIVEPIVVNRRTDTVVGGHQRIKAARLEGIEEMPVYYVDLDTTNERLLNLALNRVSGEWGEDLLETLLKELQAEGAEMDLSGFENEEIQKLMDGPQFDPISVEDVPKLDERAKVICPECGYEFTT